MTALQNFKEKLTPTAKAVEAETGIAAELGMGQSSHESGYGTSQLSRTDAVLDIRIGASNDAAVVRKGAANNLFGFTAEPSTYWRNPSSPQGNREFVMMDTHEWTKTPVATDVVESGPDAGGLYKVKRRRPFRAYKSWDESYRDWARLMATPAYVNAGALAALKAGDVDAFAAAMKKAGYATDPNYASYIARAINNIGEIA